MNLLRNNRKWIIIGFAVVVASAITIFYDKKPNLPASRKKELLDLCKEIKLNKSHNEDVYKFMDLSDKFNALALEYRISIDDLTSIFGEGWEVIQAKEHILYSIKLDESLFWGLDFEVLPNGSLNGANIFGGNE